MAKNNYDMKILIKTFGNCAKIYEKSRSEMIHRFESQEEIPEYLLDDFNINLALQAMAERIQYLTEEVAHLRGKIQKG